MNDNNTKINDEYYITILDNAKYGDIKDGFNNANKLLNEFESKLSSEQLSDILKVLFGHSSKKYLQSISNSCRVILSNPNLHPLCQQELPLIVAARFGFFDFINKFVNQSNIMIRSKHDNIGELSILIPYYALWIACKYDNYDSAQLIMEKIINNVPTITIDMFLPLKPESYHDYPIFDEEIKCYRKKINTFYDKIKLKNTIAKPESTTKFFDACKKKDNNLIQQAYVELKMDDVDNLFSVINGIMSERNFTLLKIVIEDHGSKLLSEHLAFILKFLNNSDDINYLQTIRKCCELILLNPNLGVNCCEGLPLMLAAKHGLIKIVESILNNQFMVFFSTLSGIDTVPFAALFFACKYEQYEIAKLIMNKIIMITPKYNIDMLFPPNMKLFAIYRQKLKLLEESINLYIGNPNICLEAIKNHK